MIKSMGGANHHYHHLQQQQQQPAIPFITKKQILTYSIYALFPIAFLHFYLFPSSGDPSPPPSLLHLRPVGRRIGAGDDGGGGGVRRRRCDYFDGGWVRDESRSPAYNGTTCGGEIIKDGQNCMANGRPDTGYLQWRWRPESCELPAFDPGEFLRLIRDKHLAFVGDSMARNQLESLLCLLGSGAGVAPVLVDRSGEDNRFRRWRFDAYNATVSSFWSPFLVKGVEKSVESGLDHNELHLDSPDENWASVVPEIDVVALSVGHWFLHPAVFYTGGGGVLGCHHCPGLNHTEIGFFEVFRRAVGTALRSIADRHGQGREMVVVVTTFSPAHFEGEWDKAGACPRKEPYKEGEKEMEYMDKEMRRVQVEEVAARDGGLIRFEALDVTRMAMMRPDGHPGPYMRPWTAAAVAGGGRVQNDCVHWCLPGPIDAWNEIFLQLLSSR